MAYIFKCIKTKLHLSKFDLFSSLFIIMIIISLFLIIKYYVKHHHTSHGIH